MAATTFQFALFKNGTELPNTRFEIKDPNLGLAAANPLTTYTSYFQLKGQATIAGLVATDDIELRCVLGTVRLEGDGTSMVVASMNIEKVSI